MKEGLRAILYTRVSTQDQADYGTGLDIQESECARYAKAFGMEVVGIESDPGITGTIFQRPGIQRALKRLASGEADAIVAYNAGRIGRKLLVTLTIWEAMKEIGARLFLVDMGEITEKNEFLLSVCGGFAQEEFKGIVQRLSKGKRERAQKGVQVNRTFAPYGYTIVRNGQTGPEGEAPGQYVIVEEQARIVREIFARVHSGETLRAVCRWLQEAGIPTPGADRRPVNVVGVRYWQASTVRNIVSNPVYKGAAVWGRGKNRRVTAETVTIPAPPIIGEAVWQRAQEVLEENKGKRGTRTDRRYLFTGIMKCAKCRRSMSAVSKRQFVRKGRAREEALRSIVYRCRDSNAGSNIAGAVCTRRQFYETVVTRLFAEVLERVAGHPEFLEAAYAAYQSRTENVCSETEYKQVLSGLRILDQREQATIEGFVEAVRAGARRDTCERLMQEIVSERTRLMARKKSIEMARRRREEEAPGSLAEIAASYARDLLEVLHSETLLPSEKNKNLSRYLEAIHASPDKYEFVFRPLISKPVVHVASVLTMATSKTARHPKISLEVRERVSQRLGEAA